MYRVVSEVKDSQNIEFEGCLHILSLKSEEADAESEAGGKKEKPKKKGRDGRDFGGDGVC